MSTGNPAEKRLREYLGAFADRHGRSGYESGVQYLVEEGGEIPHRMSFYSKLRPALKDGDIDGARDILSGEASFIFGNRAALQQQRHDFLQSQHFEDFFDLVSNTSQPNADELEKWIRAENQFGANHQAAYAASVLLTALFPTSFMEYKEKRCSKFADFFGLEEYPGRHVPYGDRVYWAGRIAQEFAEKYPYNKLVGEENFGWFLSGLIVHDPQEVLASTTDHQTASATNAEGFDKSERVEQETQLTRTTNTILYGPPGTGKTFSTTWRAVKLCGKNVSRETFEANPEEIREQHFNPLRDSGRIGFVTFHQSYGYEEFVEGIRPEIDKEREGAQSQESKGSIRYEYSDGTFKRFAYEAAYAGLDPEEQEESEAFSAIWNEFIKKIQDPGSRIEVSSKRNMTFYLELGSSKDKVRAVPGAGSSRDPEKPYHINREKVRRVWKACDDGKTHPENLTTTEIEKIIDVGCADFVIWLVYKELWKLREADGESGSTTLDYTEKKQDVVEVLRTRGSDGFNFGECSNGNSVDQFVLIVDEINRGNISKILGELITLLEPDKRLGQDNEIVVELPYSKEKFAVPPNLHIIGTMNTADRSIALMDSALRRRFDFEEMMPNSAALETVLEDKIEGEHADKGGAVNKDAWIDLVKAIMESINRRIEYLFDRDHLIGHSYFMDATSPKELRRILLEEVIPLIEEYFHGSREKLAMVLGCPYSRNGEAARTEPVCFGDGKYHAPLIECEELDSDTVLGFTPGGTGERRRLEISEDFEEEDRPTNFLMQFFTGIVAQDFYAGAVSEIAKELSLKPEEESGTETTLAETTESEDDR